MNVENINMNIIKSMLFFILNGIIKKKADLLNISGINFY